MDHILIGVYRARRQAQPFRAARHCRIVDRLDIDGVAAQQVFANVPTYAGVADQERNDMAGRRHDRETCLCKQTFQAHHALLMPHADCRGALDNLDAGTCSGGYGGRQGCGEDEARRETAQKVDQFSRTGDIAAHESEGLGQCSLDCSQAMREAVTL